MAFEIKEYPNAADRLPLRVARGHFATSHSHINYYVDLTMTKYCLAEAREAARILARKFKANTLIDTILCLDGTEVIGACMASELTKTSLNSMNSNRTIYVVTPEHTTGSQLIFRDNTAPMITGKHVLILAASVATGYTAVGAIEAIAYYGGTTVGVAGIFANITECEGFEVVSIFRPEGVMTDYQSCSHRSCPLCQAGVKIDAMVNTYGMSRF